MAGSGARVARQRRKKKMRELLVTTVLCAISTAAAADETLKFRAVYHITDAQSQAAADTNGHVVNLVRTSGLATMADGSVASFGFVGTLDYTNGAGIYTLYTQLVFGDGSALFLKDIGAATPEPTKVTFKGSLTVIGGKGRYEGAKGDGTEMGVRMQPLPGVGAELYNDTVINVKTASPIAGK
jgi:hypothetical protein